MFFCGGDFPGSERSVVMFLKDMMKCSVSLQRQSQKCKQAKVNSTEVAGGGQWNFQLCLISLLCFCVYVSGAGMGKKEVAFM